MPRQIAEFTSQRVGRAVEFDDMDRTSEGKRVVGAHPAIQLQG
jgi:hypothetical protein